MHRKNLVRRKVPLCVWQRRCYRKSGIILNCEENKNVLRKHYYIIVPYYASELGGSDLDKVETKNLAFSELVHVFNVRNNNQSLFKTKVFNNMKLVGAVVLSAILMLAILLVPALREIFNIVVLPTQNLVEVVLLVFAPIVIVEIFKLLRVNGAELE